MKLAFQQRVGRIKAAFLERLIEACIGLAILGPRMAIKRKPIRVLIDTSVFAHAVVHETYYIDLGKGKWGDIEFDRKKLTSVPVYDFRSDDPMHQQLQCLFALSKLMEKGHLPAFTSAELEQERWRQPMGRFHGYGFYDRSLMGRVSLFSVDGYVFFPKETGSEQAARLRNGGDSLYSSLLPFFHEKHSLDVWHLATAHRNGLDVFLTLDFAFENIYRQAIRRKNFPVLMSRVSTPKDFLKSLGGIPIPLIFFSRYQQEFPIELNISSPNGKRQVRRWKK